MIDLKAEILKAIENDLPNQVGVKLKERLAQADKDAQTVENLREMNKEYLRQLEIVKDQLVKTELLVGKHKSLDDRESELEKRERFVEITELSTKLSCEESKTAFAKEVALGLVRNIEYRKSIFDSESSQVPVADQYGNTRMEYVTNSKSLSEDSEAK